MPHLEYLVCSLPAVIVEYLTNFLIKFEFSFIVNYYYHNMPKEFIVGDIHGCFDELLELIEKIGLKEDDLLISLGDIVDRGGKSKQVFEYLSNRPNTIVLIGNHERKHLNGILSYAQEIVKVQLANEYERFLNWLRTLNYYHETDEAIIVHAAFEHDKRLNEQKEEVLSGSTSGERHLEKKYGPNAFWNDHYNGEKPIIYGHHVVDSVPLVKNNTYGIDTGACHGGMLTAIELPGFIVHQVKSKKDYWREEQKIWQLPVIRSRDWTNMEIDVIKKQLNKLGFVEDLPVRQTLDGIKEWVDQVEHFLLILKEHLDLFTKNLLYQHPDTFNIEAAKFDFKTFLYKSKANNLLITDLQKSLNTPMKIVALAKQLNLKNIPVLAIN